MRLVVGDCGFGMLPLWPLKHSKALTGAYSRERALTTRPEKVFLCWNYMQIWRYLTDWKERQADPLAPDLLGWPT